MKIARLFLLLAAFGLAARVALAETPPASDELGSLAALFQMHHAADRSEALTLEQAEQRALESNPEIAAATRRVRMAEAHVPVAGALDDPMVMYKGWGVPLEKPWDYNAAQNMFSISRTYSAAGTRNLRASVAESDVAVAQAQLEQVKLSVRVRVHKAFNDAVRAQQEMRIHDEHVGIARQAIQAARIKYTVGKVPQQDMLKAEVALGRLAEHMIRFEQDAAMARAELNTLLGRAPDAAITVADEEPTLDELPTAQSLEGLALRVRPDLAAASAAAAKSHKQIALAKRAYTPDVTLSAGYMLMPSGTDMRNDYMVEGTINLPWLNRRRHDAEIAESTAAATEQDAELAAMRNTAFGEIEQAWIEAQAAQKLARVYGDTLRPQVQAALQASVIAYENDKSDFIDLLDSQMTVVDVDLDWIQAVSDYNARLADLELAAGTPLDAAQTLPKEGQQ